MSRSAPINSTAHKAGTRKAAALRLELLRALPASARLKVTAQPPPASSAASTLEPVTLERLTIRRRRRGAGFEYIDARGRTIRSAKVLRRLRRLAVPPAYVDVAYADIEAAHLQAIGRDEAGRLQYRYHPDWIKVREARKSKRLATLVAALPRLRRHLARQLSVTRLDRTFVFAAVIALVDRTAIRAGRERYYHLSGARGAATLLKSDVEIAADTVTLRFRAKGGKIITRSVRAPRLSRTLKRLHSLPGRWLFQYRDDRGKLRRVRAGDVNKHLRDIAGASLKDFRTLHASAHVAFELARIEPAASERGRKRQLNAAIATAATVLGNTPAICRKSYVHEQVIAAFERGQLRNDIRPPAGLSTREAILARVLA